MKQFFAFYILLCISICSLRSLGQDTVYARQVIKKLTSKDFFGRGYLNNGLDKAAKYISSELERFKAKPLFATGYFQWFDFNVNTFPGKMKVKLNGKLLKPGIDFILAPGSSGQIGKFDLVKKDSLHYTGRTNSYMMVELTKKLTFSVATEAASYCAIELLKNNTTVNTATELKTIEVEIENKLLTKYINKNVCGFIPGKINNDTMIVFSAHYDHLGGMGKSTFFPGANDNASGVSMLLNLVNYYSKNPPKYKTVFLFFAGEEAGLLGSKHFTEQTGFDFKAVKFLINLDLLGTGDEGIMVVNATEYKTQFEKLNSINSKKSLVKEIRQRGKAKISDHYWFSEKGVPCFFIYTLGGIKAYHDVFDIEKTLPLTDYTDVCKLLIEFVGAL